MLVLKGHLIFHRGLEVEKLRRTGVVVTLDEKLADLLKQATEERSHYYVSSVIKEAIADRERLNKALWTAYEMLVADQDPYHVVCEAIDMVGK